MSNETLDEAGVVAKFGVRADQVLDLLTLTGDAVDNVPGVRQGRSQDRGEMAGRNTARSTSVIAHAGEIGGVVGENLRGALEWLPQGRRLLTVKTDCALPVVPTGLVVAAGRRRRAARALRALRVQELAARTSTTARRTLRRDRKRRRRRAPGAETTRKPHPAARPGAATLRDDPGHASARALARSDRARRAHVLRHRDDQPRSDAGADRRHLVRRRARARGLHSAGAPLCGRARHSSPLEPVLARLAPGSTIRPRKKLGQNVKYDQHVLANHGIGARRRRARHAARVVRARVAQAARHGQPRLAPPRREDDQLRRGHRQGRGAASASSRSSIERATEYAAEDADITLRLHQLLYPQIAADARLEFVYADDRDAGARGAVPHGAQRRADRLRAARRAEPRARRARACARDSRPTRSPASRSISARRSSSARSCSSG